MMSPQDKTACTDLIRRYAVFRDNGDARAAAKCFFVEGVLEVNGTSIKGRQAIEQWVKAAFEKSQTRHHLTTLRFLDEGHDDFHCVAYTLVFEHPKNAQANALIVSVEYLDRYILSEGHWCIEKRILKRFGGVVSAPAT